MNGKQIIKQLKQNGWSVARIRGSHHIMSKAGQRPVPVPVHGNKDLGKGLISALEKQTGVKLK